MTVGLTFENFSHVDIPGDVYRWIQEVSYRQADGQALHTVIYLSAAAILWALLYFNYLLLSVYFTPITWAVLCSIPLRRWQDSIMKSIELETSVRLISLRVMYGVCTRVVLDVVRDSVTGKLCHLLFLWVGCSRLVWSLGWSLGVLSISFLLLMVIFLYLFWKVLSPLFRLHSARLLKPIVWPIEMLAKVLKFEDFVQKPLRLWLSNTQNRRMIIALALLVVSVVVSVALGLWLCVSILYELLHLIDMLSSGVAGTRTFTHASLVIMPLDTLQHTAIHCSMLQHAATRCNTLQTLQQTATRCNTLQHAATRCNTLQHTAAYPRPAVIMTATHCNTLQHTATHCNAPNHTATHYNVPQKILPCTFLQCIVRILESIQVSSLHPVCIHHRFACCEIRWAPLQLYLVFTILWSVGQFL